MKVSEAIRKLSNQLAVHGDCELMIVLSGLHEEGEKVQLQCIYHKNGYCIIDSQIPDYE